LRLDQLSPVTKAPKGFGDTPLKPSNDKKWRLSSESESSQSESEEEWKRRAASKATISEATQILQTLEEDVRRKEAEIAALQAAMEKSKQEASKFDLNSCNVSSCENLRKSIEDTHNSRFLSTHYHCYHFCQHAIITPNQPNRQKKNSNSWRTKGNTLKNSSCASIMSSISFRARTMWLLRLRRCIWSMTCALCGYLFTNITLFLILLYFFIFWSMTSALCGYFFTNIYLTIACAGCYTVPIPCLVIS